MKRVKQNYKKPINAKRQRLIDEDRRGSVIIVVITLLSVLMLLGFFLFSQTQQEVQNAEFFAQAAKKYEPLDVDPNTIFDAYLRQLILGADPDTEYNSGFYGGYNSLLPRMLGSDFAPFSGEGVNIVWGNGDATLGSGEALSVDMDYDGLIDDGSTDPDGIDRTGLIGINQGPSGQGNVQDFYGTLPQPDVDYSYYDHNSPYLTYYGYVPVLDNTAGTTFGQPTGVSQLVVIPAFHRPAMLRNLGVGSGQWYTNNTTKDRVLRPHQQHTAFDATGNPNGVRFPTTTVGSLTSTFWGGTVPTPDDGHWGDSMLDGTYQYDADPTGRGWNDAVYMDIGYPVQVDATTGRLFVPLVAATILDAEALMNLNVHGNSSKYIVQGGTDITVAPFGDPGGGGDFLSSSNFGVTRSEINPGWVLNSGPGEAAATATEQHEFIFGHTPAGWGELSNMELWNLLHGRPEFGAGSPIPAGLGNKTAQFEGRHGESIAFDQAALYTSHNSSNFPWPGTTGTDDNTNQFFGVGGANPAFWNPAIGYPLDIFATGTNVNGGNGRVRLLHTDASGRKKFPAFGNVASNANVTWKSLLGTNLMPSGFTRNFRDETLETVVDPDLASSQVDDSIFDVSESALMQLSTFDLAATGTTGRLLNLASINFVDGAREEEIRSKMTTLSSDLKSYSRSYYGLAPGVARPWEFGDADVDGLPDFPPTLTSIPLADNRQPFRTALRELLFQEVTDKNANDFRKLQRKLQVNGVLDLDSNNDLAFRPLVPHPTTGVGPTAVASQTGFRSSRFINLPGSPALPSTSPAAQEILARIDRQKLARDIYTMLYVFGGGTDGVDYLNTSNDPTRNLYSLTQCREMAQIAVNMVDYMDPDHVMTKFEYDINLADGWNLDDYPYAGTGFGSVDTTDIDAGGQRGVVYGVEEQLLCLSEGTAIYTEVVEDSSNNPIDHEATEWDDTKQYQFFFLELENVSAFNFGSAASQFDINNEIFQVVVRPQEWTAGLNPLVDAPTTTFNERRLTLQSGALNSLGTGTDRFLTIGSATELNATSSSSSSNNIVPQFPASSFLEGNQAPADGAGTRAGPARFMVSKDYVEATSSSTGPVKVYPFDIGVDSADYLDLLEEKTDFRLFEDPAMATDYEDGPEVTGAMKGAEILDLPDPASFTPGSTRLVEVVLRRRANPNRALSDPEDAGQAEDNPWVVVDRIQVPLGFFGIDDEMDQAAEIEAELQAMLTNGRVQSLFGSPEDADMDNLADSLNTTTWDMATYQTNTLGAVNENTPTPLSIWHHHANRDYASLAELFNIPLFGPDDLNGPDAPNAPLNASTGLGPWRGVTMNLGENTAAAGSLDVKLTGVKTFGYGVLHPEGPDGDPNLTADNNRWHRVLEFMEVPTRQNLPGFTETVGRVANGQQDSIYRDYGPLNLNTIRNPEVYGGLLDAFDMMNFTNRTTTFPGLPDRLNDDHRSDWWASFAASRDQYDPVLLGSATPTFAAIPGIPGVSRPFRSLSFNGGGVNSIQSTVLRDLPFDSENRHLLEIGAVSAGATLNDPANNTIDYDLKNKLLGKVMNHSTTQSNTFFVFLQVDYFEATVVNGITRVGGKLPDSPGYRGFYVVDRAKALETLTDTDLPPTVDSNTGQSTFSFNQNFNWRALVLHRQRLN